MDKRNSNENFLREDLRDLRELIIGYQKDMLDMQKHLHSMVTRQQIMEKNLDQVNDQLEKIISVAQCCEVGKQELKSIESRIKILEDNKKWMFRLVVGAVIAAMMNIVLEYNRFTRIEEKAQKAHEQVKKVEKKTEEVKEEVKETVKEEVKKEKALPVVVQPVDENGKPISDPIIVNPNNQQPTPIKTKVNKKE
jgi:DNA repair ATPase RecN